MKSLGEKRKEGASEDRKVKKVGLDSSWRERKVERGIDTPERETKRKERRKENITRLKREAPVV